MRMRSPSGQVWQYPLSHPSARFSRFNDLVRQLDQRFDRLDRHTQSNWQRWSTIWPRSVFCLPGIFEEEPPPEFKRWAVASYQNVNCTRVDQGLAVGDVPPIALSPVQNDSITPDGSTPYAVRWIGRSSDPIGDCTCSVYARGLNHPPESGPAIQGMRFQFLAPMSYNSAFDVSPVVSPSTGLAGLRFVAMAFVVSDLGGVPIFGGRAGFYQGGAPG